MNLLAISKNFFFLRVHYHKLFNLVHCCVLLFLFRLTKKKNDINATSIENLKKIDDSIN